MTVPHDHSLEPVRGTVGDELAEELVSFWTGHGALREGDARKRVGKVVCTMRDAGGAIVAVNSVFDAPVPSVGNQRFWVYRSFTATEAGREAAPELIGAAFERLAEDRPDDRQGPLGLCLRADRGGPPEDAATAIWPISRLMLAGVKPTGEQLRIRYFEDAKLSDAPSRDYDHSLATSYRILHRSAAEAPGEDEVVDLWTREDILPEAEALRRAGEVSMLGVATATGELAGVSTAYRERNHQLGLELWHIRAFVAPPHRVSNLATHLLLETRDHCARAYRSGEDPAPGAIIEVENEELKRRFPEALWRPAIFAFIGANLRGDEVRVHWFEGARIE